jgi:hypothetical protein
MEGQRTQFLKHPFGRETRYGYSFSIDYRGLKYQSYSDGNRWVITFFMHNIYGHDAREPSFKESEKSMCN